MDGISSAPEETELASDLTVTGQMSVLLSKAQGLVEKESILGHAVISQLKVLIQTAKNGVIKLKCAGAEEINASRELEMWLERVNAVILMADDELDECRYHVLCHESAALTETNASENLEMADDDEPDEFRWYHVPRHVCPASKEPKDHKVLAYFSTLGRKIHKLMSSLSDNGLKSINSKLLTAFKDGDQLLWGKSLGAPAPDGRCVSAQAMNDSSKLESEVVEDGVQTIVDKLLSSDSCSDLSVIMLVGWGETGKNPLAQLVYKNLDVMFYFDERMWVKVPADLDTDMIAKRMLANLSRVGVNAFEEQEAVSLKKRLRGKRFLLVLVGASDIIPSWFLVLTEFLEGLGGARGSKVVITTGKYPDDTIKSSFVYLYPMRLDTSQYCWTLFDKIVSAEGGPSRTTQMEETGKAIVNACACNPLYIKLVGSLMYRFKAESQWLSISKKLIEYCSSAGGIPQLCFDYMSSMPLKRCFQYCYFFPKGCLMRREELIELWMAQGYLDLAYRSGRGMEALGREYYDVLLRSSFLQVSEDDDFDTQSCKIPDALHGLDLFTEASANHFTTIKEGNAKDGTGAVHLTLIDCHVQCSKSFKYGFSKLRSLLLVETKSTPSQRRSSQGIPKMPDLAEILGCARGLRVLIIVDASLKELPDSISKLIRLRYLDISRTSIDKLPDSISELYHLQTLRLHDLLDLPKNFEKLLVKLMHLYIHKLEDLYDMFALLSKCGELVYVSSAKATLKVFVDKEVKLDLRGLHKLSNRCSTISIHCLENASNDDAEGITEWLSEISGMEILKLNWSARRGNKIDEDVLDKLKPHQSLKELTLENFKGTRFASWMMDVDCVILSNLVKLELENCTWCEKLPPLGHLSCLRNLKIVGMDNVHSIKEDFYTSGTSGPVFAKLKEFTLCGMSKLEIWSGSTASTTAAFPYLERFEVDQCPKLEGIPDIVLTKEPKCFRRFKVSFCDKLAHLPQGLGELKCLEDLELFGLPALEKFSLGSAYNPKRLIIGCGSAEKAQKDLLMQLEKLSSLTNLTIWGYHQEEIPDCLGKLGSLEVLKFESCQHLKHLPRIISSLKELHIYYCPKLEDSCIMGSRPEWPKVSHIETIVVNSETIRKPPTKKINHDDVSEMSSACQIM